jgi:hypothetical protein
MPSAIPRATYRLQLNENFTFDDAAAVAPYLKALGISHVYASPFLKARAHSQHGYDIVDHNVINPELGGDAAFERFSATLKQNDLGLILDFVPNHMGIHFADNPWWLDVLEWGEASPYADFFDIDWDLLPYRTKGGVLLPILGTSYAAALDNGEIELRYDTEEGSFSAGTMSTGSPSRRNATAKSCVSPSAKRKPSKTPPGKPFSIWPRTTPVCAAPTASKRPLSRPRCARSMVRMRSSRAALRLIVRATGARRKPKPCTIFSSGSITGSLTGGWRAARSTIAVSSTSTRSADCGSKTCRRSRPFTLWSGGWWPKENCRAFASITSTACATPRNIASACCG